MKFISFSFLNKFSAFVIIVIILLFYIACYHFSYNFFYQDDFHLLRFVTIFQNDSIGTQQKIFTLYDQHNEHRIVFPRLIVLLDYYLQGHLDWKVLSTVASVYYLGIFVFFALLIKKMKLPTIYILPTALFIFQPSAHENFYWTISILQQVGNLFWAMFLFYSLVYLKPKNFWLSIMVVIILTFTHGNGLFGFGVGALILILQKRYENLLVWIGSMTIISGLYFNGFVTGQSSNILGSLSDPIRLLGCFGGFWGGFMVNFFKNKIRINVVIIGGILIFLGLAFINVKAISKVIFLKFKGNINQYFSKENQFLFACFLYLTITSTLVALSRSWSSIEAGIQNRYLHNSVIAFVLLYVSILHNKSTFIKQVTVVLMLLGGTIFNISSWYSTYEILTFQRKSQEADAVNYQINKISVVNDKSFNQNISSILETSFKTGVSIFPKSDLFYTTKKIETLKSVQNRNIQIDVKRDSLLEFNISNSRYRDVYHLNNFTLPYKGDVYIILKSKDNIFINPTNHRRNAKVNFLKTGQFFTDGFMTTVMTDAIPKNEYQVCILQNIKNNFIYFPTKYKILIR